MRYDISVNCYLTDHSHTTSLEELKRADRNALDYIKRLNDAIQQVNDYRLMLYKHAQTLLSTPYVMKLTIERNPNYKGNKSYTITIDKCYNGIGNETVLCERYKGTERHTAIKRFEELKKLHPGIEAIKDIEKRSWEH